MKTISLFIIIIFVITPSAVFSASLDDLTSPDYGAALGKALKSYAEAKQNRESMELRRQELAYQQMQYEQGQIGQQLQYQREDEEANRKLLALAEARRKREQELIQVLKVMASAHDDLMDGIRAYMNTRKEIKSFSLFGFLIYNATDDSMYKTMEYFKQGQRTVNEIQDFEGKTSVTKHYYSDAFAYLVAAIQNESDGFRIGSFYIVAGEKIRQGSIDKMLGFKDASKALTEMELLILSEGPVSIRATATQVRANIDWLEKVIAYNETNVGI